MNYLAHLVLSRGFPDLTIGNLSADFLSAKEQKLLQPSVFQGVLLHRYIDTIADNHPEMKACRDLIRPIQGKYTPVVMDVFFDYFLVYNWGDLVFSSFEDFEEETYTFLTGAIDQFPDIVQARIMRMVMGRWLSAYTTLDGLARVFQRMQTQLRFINQVSMAPDQLQAHFVAINKHFLVFWPQITEATHQKINELIAR